jgi:hypothetical protein
VSRFLEFLAKFLWLALGLKESMKGHNTVSSAKTAPIVYPEDPMIRSRQMLFVLKYNCIFIPDTRLTTKGILVE